MPENTFVSLAQEAFYRKENGKLKMKSREQLITERFNSEWVRMDQLRKLCNLDKNVPGIIFEKTEFENELFTNMIAKIYEPSL